MASRSKVHRLVGIALLAAIGYVLMMFSFPIIPAFPFLKLDLSDLVVLLGGLLYGPVGGIAVAFVRSLVHFALTGGGVVNLIGDWPPLLPVSASCYQSFIRFAVSIGFGGRLKGWF